MEARLFEEGTIPEWTTPEWYEGREAAPHLEQEGHIERLRESAEQIRKAIDGGARSVVDLGAGDGGLLSTIPPEIRRWGYDLQQTNVAAAEVRGEKVDLLDAVANPHLVGWADVVVVTEMLEHLVDPHGFLKVIHDQPETQWLVASSPYTETAESHYGFHTWAWDLSGYSAMILAAGFAIVDVRTAWISQCLLARRV